MAVLLSALARLEQFPVDQLEKSGAESVIQYRGQILRLIYLDVVLEDGRETLSRAQAAQSPARTSDPDSILVLVCNHEGSTVGLVVERILDIVEDRADVKSPATRKGVLYTAVIRERVTEILDLEVILRSAPYVQQQEKEPARVGD